MLNLTQHSATPDQVAAGVADLPDKWREGLVKLLTFDSLPTSDEVWERASAIAALAAPFADGAAMIGGAPFLMAPLDTALRYAGITPRYAFSRRESVEEAMPDGTVRKTAVFRHAGFV